MIEENLGLKRHHILRVEAKGHYDEIPTNQLMTCGTSDQKSSEEGEVQMWWTGDKARPTHPTWQVHHNWEYWIVVLTWHLVVVAMCPLSCTSPPRSLPGDCYYRSSQAHPLNQLVALGDWSRLLSPNQCTHGVNRHILLKPQKVGIEGETQEKISEFECIYIDSQNWVNQQNNKFREIIFGRILIFGQSVNG